MNTTNWKKKLAAWLHDPAEKALILLRDRQGHERGTVQALREKLNIAYGDFDQRADWLAAAADRPQWPRPTDERYPAWATVRFTESPILIHPLSGEPLELATLGDIAVEPLKSLSFDHFADLAATFQHDPRKTFLAFWRFGPEAGSWAKELGALWQMLPADTRVPDHSIWTHLDTVSALHTALADGDQPALLAMSFGPVQGFIAQARSTSDLWAGSHLLSSIVWAGLQALVEDIGPDAVLFPALRGVPAVDAWLLEALGEPGRSLFEQIGADFVKDKIDTNPLFAAALPNKFVAVVPSKRARELAGKVAAAARFKARDIALQAAEKLFHAADADLTAATRAQIEAQIAEFPEVFWAAAAWPVDGEGRNLDDAVRRLHGALASIHDGLKTQGIFQRSVWQVLTKELQLDGFQFWQSNVGILYPAVYELAEHSLAAAKSARAFVPLSQVGHRCTQCGEREWLTDERDHLGKNRKDRQAVSVWGKLAEKRRSWAKAGEHLCAVCGAKRLWPTLFAEEVGKIVGGEESERATRFVVSTHTLALAVGLDQWLDADPRPPISLVFRNLLESVPAERVSLPRRVAIRLHREDEEANLLCRKLPAVLDTLNEQARPLAGNRDERRAIEQSEGLLKTAEEEVRKLFGAKPEAYYALIQMDGDRMGAWMAGSEEAYQLRYRDTWHPQVRAEVENFARRDPALQAYLDTCRPPSPARHAAISKALNDFSIHVARHVVEDCCKGKLIYAGGDDVLALVAVDDLFDTMLLLRLGYSGLAAPESLGLSDRLAWLNGQGRRQGSGKLWLSKGFGLLNGRLMTLMGDKATASMGAMVAHHTAPLGMVLRQLREAENRAKSAGRDRFCLRVLKRGGGEVSVISPWWKQDLGCPDVEINALRLMKRLRDELAFTDFSRSAIYRAQLWFEGLTDNMKDADDPRWREQMAGSLAYQFDRQNKSDEGKQRVARLAREIVDYVCDIIKPEHPKTTLENFLAIAEFFARESRVKRSFMPGVSGPSADPAESTPATGFRTRSSGKIGVGGEGDAQGVSQ